VDITKFEMELTSLCSLHCFACAHKDNLKVNLSYEQIVSSFHPEFMKKMNFFSFCGARGDCSYHPRFLDIVKYFKTANPKITLQIQTNGSIHPPSWWEELASLLSGKDCVIFALDGLEDTHAIHRRGSDFNKVISNAEAFNKAGGTSYWQFIVFRHNQHQLEEAEKVSIEKGFADFDPIYSRKYTPLYQHPTIEFKDKDKTGLFYCKTKENQAIHKPFCRMVRCQTLHLDCYGMVSPCDYLAVLDKRIIHPVSGKHNIMFYKNFKKLNIHHNSLEDIINSEYFKWVVDNIHENNICSKYCGF